MTVSIIKTVLNYYLYITICEGDVSTSHNSSLISAKAAFNTASEVPCSGFTFTTFPQLVLKGKAKALATNNNDIAIEKIFFFINKVFNG